MESIFEEGNPEPDEEPRDDNGAEPDPDPELEELPDETERKPFSQRIKDWLETDRAIRTVYLGFGGAMILLLMTLLQFSTRAICCGDWDGYYHIRWSATLWESFKSFQWLPDFTWLPLTVLEASEYADHHFFFHVLQIPFLWFFEPVTAAKVSAVVFGSLAIFSVYWLLFRYDVDNLLVWLVALLACSNPFLYRLSMAKAPPLTIIFTILGVYLLFERKYFWLLPLMFVFVWTYSLFPMLFIAALIWTAIIGWNERKLEWQPAAYTFGGMVLGNVINPYFPNNIDLFITHLAMKVRTTYEVAVGGEWYPYTGWQMITHLTIALVAMLIGYILYRPRNGELPPKATFFLVFSTLLLVWMFKSKRLAEYFPPFAILFCAFSWKAFFTPVMPQLPEDFRRDIEPLLDTEQQTEPRTFGDYVKIGAPWAVGVALCCILVFNVAGTRLLFGAKHEDLMTTIKKNQADDRYGEAMEWASKNIPEGDRIFNCNWDDFPKLYYFNPRHSYVWGLDPNYLYSKDPNLFREMKKTTEGKVEDPAPFIKEDLGADWVFTDAGECEDFVANLLESGWAETVHEDGEAFILKLRDEKGEPPPPSENNPDTESEETDPESQDDADEEELPEDESLEDEELPPDDEDYEDPDPAVSESP